MKAKILNNGHLFISAESIEESVALKKWFGNYDEREKVYPIELDLVPRNEAENNIRNLFRDKRPVQVGESIIDT